MPRPRKPEAELFENWFFDQKVEDQERTLATLATIHRLKRRQKEPAPGAQPQEFELKQGEQ